MEEGFRAEGFITAILRLLGLLSAMGAVRVISGHMGNHGKRLAKMTPAQDPKQGYIVIYFQDF